MQYMELLYYMLNKGIVQSSPRRPAGRPITAHLLRWQLVDITPG